MAREYSREIAVISTVPNSSEPWLFDGLENLLVWSKSDGTNASSSVTKDTTIAYEGAASLKLSTGATTPLANDSVTAERNCVIGSQQYTEFVYFFRLATNNIKEVLTFFGNIVSGGKSITYAFQFNTANNTLKYLNSSQVYTAVTATAVEISNGRWNFLRFIVDRLNKKYATVQINGLTYDMEGIDGFDDGDSDSHSCLLQMSLQTTEAVVKTMNVDNITVRGRDSL